MENKTIARTLRLFSQLLDLHDENPFKVRSMANAAFKIDKLPFALNSKTEAELSVIDGIGKSIATKIHELLTTEHIAELDELFSKTPQGVLEIMQIKGIGPKKVATIWKELEIESIGELYYACNENRLIEAKGFGLKTQQDIIKLIEFKMANNGRWLYAKVEAFAEELLKNLEDHFPNSLISLSGDYRRRMEIIDQLDVLIGVSEAQLRSHPIGEQVDEKLQFKTEEGLNIQFQCCRAEDFGWTPLRTTGNVEHVAQLEQKLRPQSVKCSRQFSIASCKSSCPASVAWANASSSVLASVNASTGLLIFVFIMSSLIPQLEVRSF
jgi:DNA polymerase (family 10)